MSEVTARAPSREDGRDAPQGAGRARPSAARRGGDAPGPDAAQPEAPPPARRAAAAPAMRLLPVLVTLCVAAVAAYACWLLWQAYMAAPWTRDGTVRVYVVTVAPEVAGQIVDLPVRDNQYVHKGDLLMKIDPRDYRVAVDLSQAALDQAQADYVNKQSQAARRLQLTDLATTPEQKEQYVSAAKMAQADVEQQKANLDKAKINLDRTEIRSAVNGWVTNLLTQQGNYATTGATALSVVDADSFWVDGYFEETTIAPIREGDPARVYLLGYKQVVLGHVDSLARGIVVSNATPGGGGLATVNPVFTWVRLAQRVPVRVHIDSVPPTVRLVAGHDRHGGDRRAAGHARPPVADTGAAPGPGRRGRRPSAGPLAVTAPPPASPRTPSPSRRRSPRPAARSAGPQPRPPGRRPGAAGTGRAETLTDGRGTRWRRVIRA